MYVEGHEVGSRLQLNEKIQNYVVYQLTLQKLCTLFICEHKNIGS
jgi:hypothetical protein